MHTFKDDGLQQDIYLNHAGTSWPKPDSVLEAISGFPDFGLDGWDHEFAESHREIANHFGLDDPTRLLLTPGCTSALALAIADQPWKAADEIVISSWEHHAVYRPARKLESRGVATRIISPTSTGPFDLDQLEGILKSGKVRLVAVSAASNVTGDLLPVAEIVRLAHEYQARVLIDAAQVVGWMSLDFPTLGADLIAFGGHKGLQGPWGIGGLYVAPEVVMDTPAAVCRIPASQAEATATPCVPMPGYCDGGSVDRLALAGLSAAIRWLKEPAQQDRLAQGRRLIGMLQNKLSHLSGIEFFGNQDATLRIPTLAFNFEGRDSGEVASQLKDSRVFVGSGLQCAPLAHETLGTSQTGVVRLSVGPATTERDVLQTSEVIAAFG